MLNDPPRQIRKNYQAQTPVSFHMIKIRRNQSAPSTINATDKSQVRPNTTSPIIRYDRRAMSAFKNITLKPSCQTLGNLLVLLDSQKKKLEK